MISTTLNRLLLVVLLGLLSITAQAASDFPEQITVAGQTLVKNGAGKRTTLFITTYRAGLYLTQKNTDAAQIFASEAPMSMRLVIKSAFVTAEKLESALRDGFKASTNGNTAAMEAQITQLLQMFTQEINKGDVFEFSYLPNNGLNVSKNNSALGNLGDWPFAQAFFGIWLGDKPAQKSLKKALLGLG